MKYNNKQQRLQRQRQPLVARAIVWVIQLKHKRWFVALFIVEQSQPPMPPPR